MKDIIIYSKKDGVNQLLPIFGNDLKGIGAVFDMDRFKEHKLFAYALVNGVEIKLFPATANSKEQSLGSMKFSEDELMKMASSIHQLLKEMGRFNEKNINRFFSSN